MSDDISMGALSGSIEERAAAALAAGCDLILHCNGRMDEMSAVAATAPRLCGSARVRARAALAARPAAPRAPDLPQARARLAALLERLQRADKVLS
jgi:beta-N-acetylhexosaminidase